MESRLLNANAESWLPARTKWFYDPVLWFSYRMVEVAFLDAKGQGERPSDEALLARDWIATSETMPAGVGIDFVSFPECCERLGLNVDAERLALLDRIDAGGEFDNDEAWARLETLSASEPVEDVEPLFEALRIVPALDQFTMFSQMEKTA